MLLLKNNMFPLFFLIGLITYPFTARPIDLFGVFWKNRNDKKEAWAEQYSRNGLTVGLFSMALGGSMYTYIRAAGLVGSIKHFCTRFDGVPSIEQTENTKHFGLTLFKLGACTSLASGMLWGAHYGALQAPKVARVCGIKLYHVGKGVCQNIHNRFFSGQQ